MTALQGATVVQINSSAAMLALARNAGFGSVSALMPGLQMFWDDVSTMRSMDACLQHYHSWMHYIAGLPNDPYCRLCHALQMTNVLANYLL
jgi:hypothetical protein